MENSSHILKQNDTSYLCFFGFGQLPKPLPVLGPLPLGPVLSLFGIIYLLHSSDSAASARLCWIMRSIPMKNNTVPMARSGSATLMS